MPSKSLEEVPVGVAGMKRVLDVKTVHWVEDLWWEGDSVLTGISQKQGGQPASITLANLGVGRWDYPGGQAEVTHLWRIVGL